MYHKKPSPSSIDPDYLLGFTSPKQAISHYKIGSEIKRTISETATNLPEFLPFGYFVNDVDSIDIYLNEVNFGKSSLKLLISRVLLQKYSAIILENRSCLLLNYEDSGAGFSPLNSLTTEISIHLTEGNAKNIYHFSISSRKEAITDFKMKKLFQSIHGKLENKKSTCLITDWYFFNGWSGFFLSWVWGGLVAPGVPPGGLPCSAALVFFKNDASHAAWRSFWVAGGDT